MATFDRWTPTEESCYPFLVFKQYNTELKRLNMSFESAKKYTYSHLKIDGAIWDDRADKFLYTHRSNISLKDWAQAFDMYDNLNRLNNLMSLCAYFETYLASVIKLALDSDPGQFVHCTHSIDGIKLLKHNQKPFSKEFMEKVLMNCTKGDWQSRVRNIKDVFDDIPKVIEVNVGVFDEMRKLRNDVGHAFGRDIEATRDYTKLTITSMKKLSVERFLKYQKLVQQSAHQLNDQFLINHIGNYHILYFYHTLQSQLSHSLTKVDKANKLKEKIGASGHSAIPKDLAKWVVDYYDNL